MKVAVGIAVALALVAGIFLFFYSSILFQTEEPIPQVLQDVNFYANGTYGVSFPYPDAYLVVEGERGTQARPHYAIVLTHEDDISIPVGGEGPPTITIDIYPNQTNTTLEEWVTTTPESNFALGNQKLLPTTVGEHDARTYRWSGLYEGVTTALLVENVIVAISVTYLTPDDTIITDYQNILQGFTFAL
jgi:hypothetical protein